MEILDLGKSGSRIGQLWERECSRGIAHGKVPSINPRHPLNAERESEFPRACALRRTLSLRRHHALAFPSERCAEISGTIPPGAAFPNLDRCHAYAERMPAACRRMFEAG